MILRMEAIFVQYCPTKIRAYFTKAALSAANHIKEFAGLFSLVKESHQPVNCPSMYAQNKISERSEEQLIKNIQAPFSV
mgnify:CR=1 FL=1